MNLSARKLPAPVLDALRAHCTTRLETLRAYRMSWWSHWAALAEMFLPRRYRWFVTPNQYNRGSPMNASIVDETGILAARILATGLLSGLTSPNKPWFSLCVEGEDEMEEGPVQIWCAECTTRMLEVYAGSNIYTALGTAYGDNVVFGSAALIQYEHPERVLHFFNPCMGEFFFGLNNWLEVETLYREYTYTVQEAVDEFGIDNLSPGTAEMARTAANLDTEIVICHAIEPNGVVYSGQTPVARAVPASFKYRETYWEQTSASGQRGGFILRVGGFKEKPHVGLRWDVTSNDAYGRSPGMDALPAVRQLQIEQRRKAEAIDKMVRPPMVGSVSMKNEPADILPGGITYVTNPQADGFRPAFQVEPRVSELMEDLKEVQGRVQRVFFNDLFLGISQLGTVRSATEIEARQQETLVQIGPVIERTENEGLDEIVRRSFNIMWRRGLFPPPPPELANRPIVIRYVSMFAEVQRAASTAAIERFAAFAGGLVGVKPDAMDNVDVDKMIQEYGQKLNVDPILIRAIRAVMAIRQGREQQQQQAAALQVGQAAASGAKTLSETDIGGGQNALQAVTGRAA